MNYPDETIVAISTPVGQGGIGIVRLSGPEAIEIADRIFRSKKNEKPSHSPSHKMLYGQIVDPADERVVDEVLLSVMLAPNSYTREDVVEINCHGSMLSVRQILELALRHGVAGIPRCIFCFLKGYSMACGKKGCGVKKTVKKKTVKKKAKK